METVENWEMVTKEVARDKISKMNLWKEKATICGNTQGVDNNGVRISNSGSWKSLWVPENKKVIWLEDISCKQCFGMLQKLWKKT